MPRGKNFTLKHFSLKVQTFKNCGLSGWLDLYFTFAQPYCFFFTVKLWPKWKISATAAAFLDHLLEIDETSWLPQRHVIYERVIQKHVIYGFHEYKWFTHSFVAFMVLGSFSQKYSTDNQLVPKKSINYKVHHSLEILAMCEKELLMQWFNGPLPQLFFKVLSRQFVAH